jgi:hypothetical protein
MEARDQNREGLPRLGSPRTSPILFSRMNTPSMITYPYRQLFCGTTEHPGAGR